MPDTFANLLAAVPIPLMLLGFDGKIESANDHANALLGQSVIGRHYVTSIRQPLVLEAIEEAYRNRKETSARYLSTDGDRDLTFVVRCVPFESPAGPLIAISFEDETQLHATRQMRSDFVANVSHELKTPLTSILGFVETLRGPARDDPKAQERFLGLLEKEAQRMDRLVRDLLSLNRVEADERMRPNQIVALGPMIAQTLEALDAVAREKQITLLGPKEPVEQNVVGDGPQLAQVLRNLVENAINYSPEHSEVEINVSNPTDEVLLRCKGIRISVRDTGPGIDAHDIPRLTERFYRVDDHRSREVGGTGLGLAIVKHILNRHRGRLEIRSTLGQGSTFTVILPVTNDV